jgi:hypothetical protein
MELLGESLGDTFEQAGGVLLAAAQLGAMVREPREDRLLQLLGQLLDLEAQRRALTLRHLGALLLLKHLLTRGRQRWCTICNKRHKECSG